MAVLLLGAPIGSGAGRRGCEAGPRALRQGGLRQGLAAAGRAVADLGDVPADAPVHRGHPNSRLKALPEVAAAVAPLRAALRAVPGDATPVVLGGDHSLSLGTVPGAAERAARLGRPFFLLWLDAHPDCHTLDSSESGNLHGTPVAHALGADGFAPAFDAVTAPVPSAHVLMLGIRDVDAAERAFLDARGIAAHDPGAVRAAGLAPLLRPWLDGIRAVGGLLHVSLDADVLDPAAAPGVGTPVAGGFTVDEVGEALGLVAASGTLGSLDLVEVNPFLDRDRRTARAMAGLAATALGAGGRSAAMPASAGRTRP